MRSGSTVQELKGAALDRFLMSRYGRTWDGTPIPNVSIGELSADAFNHFRRLAKHSGRLAEDAISGGNEELLEQLRLIDGAYLKRSGVLLFHPDPLRHIGGAYVKIGFFREPAELVFHDEVVGDLFRQVHQTLELLLTKYLRAAIRYDGIVRVERFPVPLEALREAVLNAIVHRDYMVPAPVQIRVYDDRLEIWNPASLPNGWTTSTLRGHHSSRPHNPDIANAFFRAGEIEAWGRGIARMFSACKVAGSPVPEILSDAGGLTITFSFEVQYQKVLGGKETHSPVALPTDPVTDPVALPTDPVTDPVALPTDPVTDPVDQLLRVLQYEALSPSFIQRRLGLRHRPTFRANYLYPALVQGLIEMTIPEQPNSRLQQYRITDAGRRRLLLIEKV